MSTWTMISIWTFKINNNIFSAYYCTGDKNLSIAYNWHTIYVKGITAKDYAINLLKTQFRAWPSEVKFFEWLDLRKLKIPEKTVSKK